MGLFGNKNRIKEYVEFEKFSNDFDCLLSMDKYISKSDYLCLQEKLLDSYKTLQVMIDQEVFYDWCKNKKVEYKSFVKLIEKYKNIENIIKNHNEKYISNHLKTDKEYLDKILEADDPNILLDDEQRKVVLSDEDYTLVIAGAGAGKTTTIEAKVKYLVDKQNIDPSRILIVSFTKKATNELKERFIKLNIPVEIATFHSIGNTIIKQNEPIRHKIVTNGFMFDSVKEYLTNKLDDEYFIKKILLFFASYLNMPFDGTDTSILFKTLNDNVTTLKSDIKNMLDSYQKEQTKNRRTLNDERVRSIDECRIANFLFINGIDYDYEPIYQHGFRDSIKTYCPDFLIKQGNKKIYLEHFGISEDGKNNRFTDEELNKYKKAINEKITLHKQHKTELIYTFSKYNDGIDLIKHLEKELIKAGITFDTKNDIEIYKKIAKNAEEKYFNKFITLICAFISRFKVNNYSPSKFDEWKINLNNKKEERTKLFVDICYQCYLSYCRALKDNHCIDFEDMINNASNVLDKFIKEGINIEYDYILVDEYQDISLQRFDLCEKLSQASKAKIIAVGDDWQSIFRFSGAKIDLFTKFEERMGYANVLKITKTYRNSQELIDIAGGFVMSNEEQIKKNLKSNKRMKDPVILMSYDDSYDKEKNEKGPFYNLGEAIEKSLEQIVKEHGINKSVLLIGRYGFDGRNLSKLDDFFDYQNGRVVSKKYPDLNISFLTAHSSKGLGYDNVIIINGKDDILGFPSKIEDDPVMKLVIKEDEKIDFAEERRLFYVALTRTKNRVYIVTPQLKPSKFILEIKDHFTNVILKGTELTPVESIDYRRACPVCSYPLQLRKNNNFKFKRNSLWICSNDPELCGFVTNDLKGGKLSIGKCPDCEDGYLIVKTIKNKDGKDTGNRMLGCTNYKSDKSGCMFMMHQQNYTQDKNKISIQFYDSKMNIDKMIYAGYPIKSLISLIKESIMAVENKYKNFKFNKLTLREFLVGNYSKPITSFNLDKFEQFGQIDSKYASKILKLLDCLEYHEFLEKNSNNFNSISLNNIDIDEEDIKNIFSELTEK